MDSYIILLNLNFWRNFAENSAQLGHYRSNFGHNSAYVDEIIVNLAELLQKFYRKMIFDRIRPNRADVSSVFIQKIYRIL